MITIQLPELTLPLLGYILAANLLTIFIGYVAEHKITKPYIFDSIYLFLIISTLLIFFSAALHSTNFEIWAITIIVVCYILMAFIFVFIISYWLMTAVKGMGISREYKKELKKKEKLKEE
jgi:ABC-type microcin C transport system permease subunit YejB